MEFKTEIDQQELFDQLAKYFPEMEKLAIVGPGVFPDCTTTESKDKD